MQLFNVNNNQYILWVCISSFHKFIIEVEIGMKSVTRTKAMYVNFAALAISILRLM